MFCENCGKPLQKNYQFCDGCGSKVAVGADKPKKNRNKLVVVVIISLLIVGLGAGGYFLWGLWGRPAPIIHDVHVGEIIQFGGRDWRVLEVQGNYAKILHETVIVNQPYHHTFEDVTWATSSSRAWLNGEFFNSFSDADRARIRETYVTNNDNPWTFYNWTRHRNHMPGGANTTDRIFLLSIDEVVRHFGDSGMLERGRTESNRDFDLWDYGLAGWGFHDRYSNRRIAYHDAGSASWWWLRSPGFFSDFAAFVLLDGLVHVYGHYVSAEGGLRPALWLNLES
ncbi:MAG: zinc ribbon domain-containing protein [Defluviitaleaceae bacterium]|nr:zinc ribbon domain-containing protein [Defluviitaleaceae bacterium]